MYPAPGGNQAGSVLGGGSRPGRAEAASRAAQLLARRLGTRSGEGAGWAAAAPLDQGAAASPSARDAEAVADFAAACAVVSSVLGTMITMALAMLLVSSAGVAPGGSGFPIAFWQASVAC